MTYLLKFDTFFHTHDARIMTHHASRIRITHRVDLALAYSAVNRGDSPFPLSHPAVKNPRMRRSRYRAMPQCEYRWQSTKPVLGTFLGSGGIGLPVLLTNQRENYHELRVLAMKWASVVNLHSTFTVSSENISFFEKSVAWESIRNVISPRKGNSNNNLYN